MLSIGVNGGSAPPAVPWNQPFLWRDEGTGSQIIAMWHPGVLMKHNIQAFAPQKRIRAS